MTYFNWPPCCALSSIIALFFAAVVWACLGSVDIVATAPGKIIPSGRTKVIQPFETVVRAIHVRDGLADVLIELDPTMNAAELEHLKSDLIAAELDIARLRAALAGDANPLKDFRPPEGASPALDRGTIFVRDHSRSTPYFPDLETR